jgi:transcriptional regulator with XRE-family HTH domain
VELFSYKLCNGLKRRIPLKQKKTIYIGDLIVRLRKAGQLSQEDLAFDSSLSRKYISEIETIPCNPTYATIVSLAIGLGLKPSELFIEIGKISDKEYINDTSVSN